MAVERTAATLLRSTPGGNSHAPFTRHRPCRRRSLSSDISMKNSLASVYGTLHAIYSKYRQKHRENPDSKQMCCMWSTNDPPDIIEGTEPLCDIEAAFDIRVSDDDAWISTTWIWMKQHEKFSRSEKGNANKPDTSNPAITSRFHTGHPWRGVADPGRYAP